MRLEVSHLTTYSYELPARSSINELRLSPEDTPRQCPGDTTISINPIAELTSRRDLFGNLVHDFTVEEKHPQLTIVATSSAQTLPTHDLADQALNTPLNQLDQVREDDSLHEFLVDSACVKADPTSWREAINVKADSPPTLGGIVKSLSDFIFASCEYRTQEIHFLRTATEVQQERWGTCQDFSHLLINYCRTLGIPTRYISGYLYDPGLDGISSPEFIGSGMTHAWIEFFVPSVGWVGIDPTNRRWVDEHYISLAFGRDYHDVAPIRGNILGGGKNRKLEVSVTVRALD